jgi:OPA family phosphoglycerate-like MFS transporter
MPLAIISTLMIIVCIVGYWKATSVVSVVIFTAMIGCLIYIPQFLASVQGMEIVPSFAVGSMTGLRGFMSYIVGATAGTTLIGIAVDRMGWDGGIMVLFGGSLLCVLFCILAHIQVLKMNRRNVTPAPTVTDTPTPVSRTTV